MYKEHDKDSYVFVGGRKVLLKKNNGIPFIKSDLRRCELRYTLGFKEVYTYIFQIDILRLINMCKTFNNIYYIEKFKKFINQIDKINENEKTDFERKVPRRPIESGYVPEKGILE